MQPLILASVGDRLHDWFDGHGSAVIATLVVTMIATFAVSRIVPAAIRRTIARQMSGRPELEIKRRADTLASVIARTLNFVLIALAILTILPEFGMDIRALLAGVTLA